MSKVITSDEQPEYGENKEPTDFEKLLYNVKNYKGRNVDNQIIDIWRKEFQRVWSKSGENWEALTDMLPLPKGIERSIYKFNELLKIDLKSFQISKLVFLALIAIDELDSYSWRDKLTEYSIKYVAGCINLGELVRKSRSKIFNGKYNELKEKISSSISYYPTTFIAIRNEYPKLFEVRDGNISFVGRYELSVVRMRNELNSTTLREYFVEYEEDVQNASAYFKEMLNLDKSFICELLRTSISDKKELPYEQLLRYWLPKDEEFEWRHNYEQLVRTAIESKSFLENNTLLTIARHIFFESNLICSCFSKKYYSAIIYAKNSLRPEKRDEYFDIWAGYLTKDGFEYYWRYLNAKYDNNSYIYGDSIESRLSSIEGRIIKNKLAGGPRTLNIKTELIWRNWTRIFRPLLSLMELYDDNRYRWETKQREEAWVRQTEAIETIKSEPDLAESVIKGILNYGKEYWDVFDPIILGLPKEEASKTLEHYSNFNHQHEKRYHAMRLLHHLEGNIPSISLHQHGVGILSAVENLIMLSRTRIPKGQSSSWINDVGIESLLLGSLRKANDEFIAYYDDQYGQDEHEHVAVLGQALSKNINDISETIRLWLDKKHVKPAFLQTSIKRFPKTSRGDLSQEGGVTGCQADMAVILRCDIPDSAISDRITFIQAKKISKTSKGDAWLDSAAIDQTQMIRALDISEHFYYLFFLASELGPSPLLMPARLVKDIAVAQSTFSVPVHMMLSSSKELPDFFLYDVIGLWAGDTNIDLINDVIRGAEQGQGPRVLLEVVIRPEKQMG